MSTRAPALRVATRGSALALAQTRLAVEALRRGHPELSIELVEVSTEGDRDRITPLSEIGGRGVFVRAVEEALLDGRADFAVHSLKDMPTDMPEGLVIGTMLERGDPRDVLVASGGRSLAALPDGARVGTSSRRRAALLLALRPGLTLAEIRGNVDTRLRKVSEGEYAATVLAAAGLARLGRLREATQTFDAMEFPPAPGQGVIALECRADDHALRGRLAAVDHAPTRAAAEAERSEEPALGTGCSLPVAAYARLADGLVVLRGMLAAEDGSAPTFGDATGSPEEAEALGRGLAARLIEAYGRPWDAR